LASIFCQLNVVLVPANILKKLENTAGARWRGRRPSGLAIAGTDQQPACGISTNWVNVSGSTVTNKVIIPLSVNNGTVFYRLMYAP
jgi:hypothetical protein